MNQRVNPSITAPVAVTGDLLYTGYQLTDTLQVDLYGDEANEDSDIDVTGVTLTGSKTDITELFSAHQLYSLGRWVQFKDDTNPSKRDLANQARNEAARLPM